MAIRVHPAFRHSFVGSYSKFILKTELFCVGLVSGRTCHAGVMTYKNLSQAELTLDNGVCKLL
jgi:hypothetical protein